MYTEMKEALQKELASIQEMGLYKEERIILTPQGPNVKVREGEVINFCANNYLGLSNHPRLIRAAREGLERYGYGMSSVRFICGTQDIQKELDRRKPGQSIITTQRKEEDKIHIFSGVFDDRTTGQPIELSSNETKNVGNCSLR